ncbi:FGGY-family carbohydrate kinase [Sulfurivermis fontis]|uniref:FGGY-family carbohydrate kinase n=1 Tax=Sulfurivermis fontis TaxID=1972068 RepID=UPI000FD73F2C|nr:FGGY-family carbohydrate kinase [Sulfurivermis fontis]
MTRNERTLAVGIDFGTSGCRAIAIDRDGSVQAEVDLPLPPPVRQGAAVEQEPSLWASALHDLFTRLLSAVPAKSIGAIAVDGTSGTVLLADVAGAPLGPALMYNDGRATAEAAAIAAVAPRESAAHGTASGLAKLLWLRRQPGAERAAHLLTQTDYLNGLLGGRHDISDANNCLKSGYDAVQRGWPGWLEQLGIPRHLLPQVVTPGTTIGSIHPELALRYGFAPDTQIVAGTTDSTAAFLATGAAQPGEAVTSLGSTLVLKVISERPVFTPEYGVYSQPLGELWLVGGGSNSGGAVLRQFFTDAAMAALTPRLRPERPTGLDYYPLPAPGERFPVCDPTLPPRLTPRPDDAAVFFQGLLEGIARIEQRGYQLLAELGAPWPVTLRTVGGGARNPAWTALRHTLLQVPMVEPRHTQAAYGAALLARKTLMEGH